MPRILKKRKMMIRNKKFRILQKQNTTMMKNAIRIIVLMLITSNLAFGQYEPKGKVTKAEMALNSGKLDEAKAEIDLAFEVDEKGKVTTNAKNWYTRGNIYKAIYLDTGQFNGLDPQALEKAVKSYNKVIEIENKENGTYTFLAHQELLNLYNSILDNGATAYNEGDLETALEKFTTCLVVRPADSLSLLYGGSVAQELEKYGVAADLYGQLIKSGKASESVYNSIIYIYKAQLQNPDKALEYTNMAIKQFLYAGKDLLSNHQRKI